MPPISNAQLARTLSFVTGGGIIASYMLVSLMPNQETAPLHARTSTWSYVNLGADRIYFHFGSFLRKFVDPEDAHRQAIQVAGSRKRLREMLGLVPPQYAYPALRTTLFESSTANTASSTPVPRSAAENDELFIDSAPSTPLSSVQLKPLEFWNPVGLAAGFDKNAEAVEGLLEMGFGFVEIGSVTPLPQPGNPKPRVFRLEEDRAIINRYGFNSLGMDAVWQNLNNFVSNAHFRTGKKSDEIVGVNLGKNKETPAELAADDYVKCIDKLGAFADYLVVNVSSPNTPGLRSLQRKEELSSLLSQVKAKRDAMVLNVESKDAKKFNGLPALFVKIAPDLNDEEKRDIADVCLSVGMDGLIISNTTVARDPQLRSVNQREVGGLSGAPLKHVSTQLISDMYQLTQGKLVLIGVGGVETGIDAYEKVKAGASLVQIYSSFAYGGPYQLHIIKRDLNALLKRDGFSNIQQAVGFNHRR